MPADPRLLTLPALVALAETNAKARYAEWARQIANRGRGPVLAWPLLTDVDRAIDVETEMALLSDLSRPASRDAVARLVAEAAPNLRSWEVTAGCDHGGGRLNMVRRTCGLPELGRWEPDPPPAEALALIALAVLGAPRE